MRTASSVRSIPNMRSSKEESTHSRVPYGHSASFEMHVRITLRNAPNASINEIVSNAARPCTVYTYSFAATCVNACKHRSENTDASPPLSCAARKPIIKSPSNKQIDSQPPLDSKSSIIDTIAGMALDTDLSFMANGIYTPEAANPNASSMAWPSRASIDETCTPSSGPAIRCATMPTRAPPSRYSAKTGATICSIFLHIVSSNTVLRWLISKAPKGRFCSSNASTMPQSVAILTFCPARATSRPSTSNMTTSSPNRFAMPSATALGLDA